MEEDTMRKYVFIRWWGEKLFGEFDSVLSVTTDP